MTPENWRRVNRIYDEVLEKPAEEWEQFLDGACAADPPEVRDRIEKLLLPPDDEDDGGLFNDVRDLVGAVLHPDFEVSDEAPPDLPGYKFLRVLDKGGMGLVWLVLDLQFQRLLAVKVMRAGASGERFFAEARITAKLAHPSIIPVHAMGTLADGRPYYTMKLVEGKSLAEKLQAEPDLASQRTELLQIFARVCEAMAFAHRFRVIHRDLKPIHVMVGEHGEVYVIDWGLAKMLGRSDVLVPAGSPDWPNRISTIHGQVMGTWAYMPPEQANGRIKEMDRRSDVFGLGGILCVILTGKPPYLGTTLDDVMRQARDADLSDAYARLETCGADAELIELAKHCLAKEPDDRPQDAREVAMAVKTYLADVQERAQKARVAQAVAEEKIARALMAAMGGDLEAAEEAIAEAELAGASTGHVRMLRGQTAFHRGQSREAMRHLEQAVQLLPNSVAARGMLAAVYGSDGHWDWYEKTIRKMAQLTPSTPADFLFKGYAEAYLDPKGGLETIQQAFDRRPMLGIALLLRAEVRAWVAQDTGDLEDAEGAVQDANFAKELLRNNPASLWVSLQAHLAKACVSERSDESDQRRRAELVLAEKDAAALKPYTALPKAVVFRWQYFREVGREEEVLEELRQAGRDTDHSYVNLCFALTLYRRGDLDEALRVLARSPRTYNDRLLPFVLAEHDYPDKHNWPARAEKAHTVFAEWIKDWTAGEYRQSVLCLLGKKEQAVKASKALLAQPESFFSLRQEPILQCLRYNAGDISADELLQSAGRSRWNQCLAHYNIAMTKLADGDREGAKKHFDKAVETRARGWGEYHLSWVFQARLKKDSKWPPWIPQGEAK
jgi:tetratricopeptide (TPR) repeat protein/predicted Ser/Thr protein kinase